MRPIRLDASSTSIGEGSLSWKRSARLAQTARAHPDRCRNRVPSQMSFFFGLSTPVAVFAVASGEGLALGLYRAGGAQSAGLSLASNPCLRAFCFGRKEEVGATLADSLIHPFESLLAAAVEECVEIFQFEIE